MSPQPGALLLLAALGLGICSSIDAPAHQGVGVGAHSDESTPVEDSVIRFLKQKIASDPLDFLAMNKLAKSHLLRFDSSRNTQHLKRARQLANDSLEILQARLNPEALEILAEAQLMLHQFTQAAKSAKTLTEIAPDNARARMLLGDAHYEMGSFEASEQAYEALVPMAARATDIRAAMHARFAQLAMAQGQMHKAAGHVDKALKAARKTSNSRLQAWCYWKRGQLSEQQGRWMAAEQHYVTALSADESFEKAESALHAVRVRRAQPAQNPDTPP